MRKKNIDLSCFSIIMLSFFLCCTYLSMIDSVLAQDKPKEFRTVVKALAAKLLESNQTGKPQRLAVITFIPTKNKNLPNEFGEYITESLISELSVNKKAFKLFERGRLDMVLKENDLMLSDLMDQKQAIRVGELVPIDVLFSGSFTRLKSYIDINCRLIDVVTGEIIVSFSERIELDENIESLFSDDDKSAKEKNAGTGDKDACMEKAAQIRTSLKDLTTQNKIQKASSDARAIPFDLKCGDVHFSVISSFLRYKISDDDYTNFLLKTIDTITFPANDNRASESLRYFFVDSTIDEREWQAGLKVIRRYNYGIARLIKILFSGSSRHQDLTAFRRRIDGYFELAGKGQIGLPLPFHYNSCFFMMTDGLKDNKDNRLLKFVYENYSSRLDPEEPVKGVSFKKTTDGLYSLLIYMYKSEADAGEKKVFLQWLADFFNASEKSENASKQLFDFARSFELSANEDVNQRIRREYPADDLAFIVKSCRNKFTEYALMTPYKNQLTDRIHFCAANDIPVPGGIPTMSEASEILKGDNWEEKVRIMKILELMKDKPREIESALVQLTKQKEIDRKKDLIEIQKSAMVVLGNLRTENPDAIRFMIENTVSFDYSVYDRAKDALVKIGKPAVPHLLSKLRSLTTREDSFEYQIIVVLGRIGKDARAAKADIEAILKRTTHKERRSTFEAALQAME